jgi:hypothetical protein
MTNELHVWQLILLGTVYLTDLVLIVRLGRDELRDRGDPAQTAVTAGGSNQSAAAASVTAQ